jgi:hypothetical protein
MLQGENAERELRRERVSALQADMDFAGYALLQSSLRCGFKLKSDARALRFAEKKFATRTRGIRSRDFRTATSRNSIIIFFLTSFFINSIHQLVAVEDRCKFSMKNGRENRNNGNQEEGEKEKETLREVQYEVRKGDAQCVP